MRWVGGSPKPVAPPFAVFETLDSAQETKSPASQAGLEQLPVGTLLAKPKYNIIGRVR